jgi:hypothetical protein
MRCCLLQVYDAPSHPASNTFLTLRANVSISEARDLLAAPSLGSAAGLSRCPLPEEKLDGLLAGDNPDLYKPGAFCRCSTSSN